MNVAVIIPLWNGSAWIGQCLDSVLAQMLRPREVVVVDDGSSDGSPDIVRGYPEVLLLKNPNKGSSGARNFGLAHTSAPLVAFLDQDDLWHETHLKLLCEVLWRVPDLPAAVASTSPFCDGERPRFNVTHTAAEPLDPWVSYPFHDSLGLPTPSAVLMRRAALHEVGDWDSTYLGAVDYYLWLRLSEKRPLMRLAATTVGYRQYAASQKNRLRLSDGLGYFHRKTRASADALEHRLPWVSSQAERAILQRRRDAALGVYSLAEAFVVCDQAGVIQAARRMETLLANESAVFRQRAFRTLAWFLGPSADAADESKGRTTLLNDLYQVWPPDAAHTRGTLRELLGLQKVHLFSVVTPLFLESSWPQRSAMLLRAFRRKIRALTNPPKAPFQ
ncbi:glycosyltransferase [Candidatus Methylomirabilis sp.]|uniref:glycosyltransferase family 2 protein n=1 Tax=Candidatus Methylomirabilis sp. TaxID=2032687 RepID=UPI003076749B